MCSNFLTNCFKNALIVLVILGLAFQSFIINPSVSSADSAIIKNTGSAKYAESAGGKSWVDKVGVFTVNGDTAFCVEHDKLTPADNTPNLGENPYKGKNSAAIKRALYYGWGGPESIFGSNSKNYERGYVVTSLVLSRLYTGDDAGGDYIDGYSELWNLAQSGSIPSTTIDFSAHTLTTKVDGNKQVSQDVTFEADSSNSVTFTLPSGMHLVKEDTGKSVTGKVTLKGGEKFYLWASLTYNNNWSSGDLYGSLKTFQPFLTKMKDSSLQSLVKHYWIDPKVPSSFSVNFFPRTVNVYAQYIDTYDNSVMWQESKGKSTIGSNYSVTASTSSFTGNGTKGAKGATYKETGKSTVTGKTGSTDVYVKFYFDRYWNNEVIYQNKYPNKQIFKDASKLVKVNGTYQWTIPHAWKDSGNTYDLYNDNGVLQTKDYNYTGTQPNKDLSKKFLYILRRSVTVNYIDNRTGASIKKAKTYTIHQGDAYQETPPGITTTKNGKTYTYRYVRASVNNKASTKQTGTIGTSNITINYYYDIPLMQIGVKDLQIYTAPKENGLPVKVALDRVYNYSTSISDMASKKISVSLYQGSTRVATSQYAAKSVPTNLTFTIPSSFTKGKTDGSHLPYTVKFEGYSANDFDVITGEFSLTTRGYTCSKNTIDFDVNSNSSHSDSSQYVVRTESSVSHPTEVDTYETFKYYARPIPKMKTGYGLAADVTLNYSNELGHDYNYATDVAEDNFTFQAPSVLQDTSYLDYRTKDGKVNVPLLSHRNINDSASVYQKSESFKFPHVNVEDKTGKLFTDQQVSDHDGRIKNKLYDGGYQFYTPIWPDKSQNIPANYNVDYSTNRLGVNKVTLKIKDQLRLVAYMYAWMGSPTIRKDELLMEPVNTDNPFPDGLPAGFTKADEQWIKND